jgi:hypothetical protein
LSHHNPLHRLTAEEIEVRIWGFVVIVVTMILAFIVFALLYSVTFVVQPIKSMAPIDMAYTKMLNDIVLLIVGGIGGVMSKKGVHAVANAIAPPPQLTYNPSPAVQPPLQNSYTPVASSVTQGFNWMGFQNPALDESWTPPPPPSTPADYVDPAKEEIAHERAAAQMEPA